MDKLDRGGSGAFRRFVLLIGIWMLALAAGLALDTSVANWVDRTIPIRQAMPLFRILKAPGHFLFTLSIAAALAIWHPWRWRAGGLLCLCGMLSGLLGALMKWGVGRTRPFKGVAPFSLQPFRGGLAGLFHAENLSFPSGHTVLAFATAECLSLLVPRWRPGFYAGALLVATERILQNSHYLGDVVVAAGLGFLSVHLTWWICRTIFPQTSTPIP